MKKENRTIYSHSIVAPLALLYNFHMTDHLLYKSRQFIPHFNASNWSHSFPVLRCRKVDQKIVVAGISCLTMMSGLKSRK